MIIKKEKNFDELRITQRWEQGQRETYSSINYVLSTWTAICQMAEIPCRLGAHSSLSETNNSNAI